MIIRAISLLFGLVLVGMNAHGDDHYAPPPVGTLVTWSFGNSGERETRLSKVVAVGDDFVIYHSDLRLSEASASSYFVEFSGIHRRSCAQAMPDNSTRTSLASIWPMKSGDTIEFADEFTTTYTIGDLTSHTLNVVEGPTEARHIKAIYGNIENDITFSLNWHMPVAIGWPDGTGDKALEVVLPVESTGVSSDLFDAIGNCATLLEN